MTMERDVLRDVEAALDISPSAGFEARVHERVRTQSMRAPRWMWAAGVAVAATVVVAVMLVPDQQRAVSRVKEQPSAAAAQQIRPADESPARATELESARRSARRAIDATHLPAAVIPEGQAQAIQRLMASVAAGRVAMAPERPRPPEVLDVAALSTIAPITFDPIRFKPLSADESPDLWR
jgi:hypothetical protein